jgi:hypothetical protein
MLAAVIDVVRSFASGGSSEGRGISAYAVPILASRVAKVNY